MRKKVNSSQAAAVWVEKRREHRLQPTRYGGGDRRCPDADCNEDAEGYRRGYDLILVLVKLYR